MYVVETDADVNEQVAALPAEVLHFYAELMTMLALSPWSGEIYNRERPDTANMRHIPSVPMPRVSSFILFWNENAV